MVFRTRVQEGYGKNYSFHKVPYIIKTALKLASINAYDDEYRIRNSSGEYLPNTNVHDLLNHCMSVGRKLTAENEFIELLAEAKIDPDWILNENVKAKLIPLVGYRKKPAEYRQHPSQMVYTSRKFTDLPPPHETITVPGSVDGDEENELSDDESANMVEEEVVEDTVSKEPIKRKRGRPKGAVKRRSSVLDEVPTDRSGRDSTKRARWELPPQ